MLIISGCNDVQKSTDIYMYPNGSAPHYISSLEDIQYINNELINKERFFDFLNNVKEGKEDCIRVVRRTTEGDQLIRDLEYDGEILKSTTDLRMWNPGPVSIITTTCTSIEADETFEGTDYVLQGCEHLVDNSILVVKK